MKTRTAAANEDTIAEAAGLLRAGELVAFPTETVYGLGANALNAAAVQKIYEAKGRPSNNPTIVHVSTVEMARKLVTHWPESAAKLAASFWPGPLTLILPRNKLIPGIVTAGGATVGIRVPAHPVALTLIRVADVPIAAPSANKSGEVSPTRAEHVAQSLAGRVSLILDGGPTDVGIESTVLDLSDGQPGILRPGAITSQQIEAALGVPVEERASTLQSSPDPQRSPGQLERHYAPRAQLLLVSVDEAEATIANLLAKGKPVGWMSFNSTVAAGSAKVIRMPTDPPSYGKVLYDTLHKLDTASVDVIVAELPPQTAEWTAIHDRLRRASAKKI